MVGSASFVVGGICFSLGLASGIIITWQANSVPLLIGCFELSGACGR